MPEYCMFVPSPATSQLDTSDGNATAALYSAVIGPINIDYYLPIFTQLESQASWRPTWNWAACLHTVNWLIFRGLGRVALVYAGAVAIAALLFGAGRVIFQWSWDTEVTLLAVLALLAFSVPGLLGNRWFYTVTRQKMGNALRDSATLAEACTLLARRASSRQRFLKLLTLNTVVVAAAAGLYGWNTFAAIQAVPAGESSLSAGVPTPAVSAPTLKALAPAKAEPMTPASASPVSPATELPTPAVVMAPVAGVSAVQSGPVTDMVPAPPEPAPLPLASTSTSTSTSAPTPSTTPTRQQTTPSVITQLAEVVKPPLLPEQRVPPARQRYYINVGLFAKEANAQNALDRLEQANVPTLSSTLRTPKGDRTRVRAGPYNSQREAEAAAVAIRALKLDAVVVQPAP